MSQKSASREEELLGECGRLEVNESHLEASDSEDVSSLDSSTPLIELRGPSRKGRKPQGEGAFSQRSGHWDEEENRKYFLFLTVHHNNFERKNLRRSEKIFKVMSRYLGTRTADQCRSHHQKMEKKCLSFQKILEYLAENYSDGSHVKPPLREIGHRNRRDYVPRILRPSSFSTFEQLKEMDSPVTATTND